MLVASIDSPTQPETKYIETEDEDAYSAWLRPHVLKYFPLIPTQPLYHYTTGSGLIDILKSGELWSTQLSCLNDACEFLYPIGRVLCGAQPKLASPISSEVKPLLEEIITQLTHPQRGTEGRFVACFSEDGDDLNQWRAYGSGEGGYAIQFDSAYLRGMSHNQEMVLGKIEYDPEEQAKFIDEIIEQTVHFFLDGLRKHRAPTSEEWLAEFLPFWSAHIAMFGPLIKHPTFSAEREWRLVYHFQDDAIPRMRYLPRNSMMTKYVPLRLMMQDGKPRLPLTGIVVGPCRHKDISRISVGDLLRTHGYVVDQLQISTTKIPYQAV
jgi:hypothetical protein